MLRDGLVVVGAFLCYMIADGATYSFGVLYIALLEEFQQSKALTALVGALMMGLPQIAAPLVCSYVGAYGPRVSAFTAALLLALAFLVTRLACTVEFLYFSVGVIGSVGLELAYVSAMVAVELSFKKKLALATGLSVAGSGIGMCVFAPLVDFLIQHFGWRDACSLLAALCLNLAVSGSLFPGTRTPTLHASMQLEPVAGPKAGRTQKQASRCSQLMGDFCKAMGMMFDTSIYTPRFLRFCVANFAVAATVLVPLTFLVHKAEVSGLEASKAALLLSFAGLSSSAGQITLGLLAANCCQPRVVYVVALSLCGLVVVAMAFVQGFAMFALMATLFGFSYGAYYALMSVMLVDYVSHDLFTAALAIYALFQGAGDIITCPLAGLAFDITGSYDVPFIISGASLTICIIVFLGPDLIRKKTDRQGDQNYDCVPRGRSYSNVTV